MTIERIGTALFTIALAVAAGGSAAAQADVEPHEVSWMHPSPGQVHHFIVSISPVKGPSEEVRRIDVGKPAGESTGSYQFFTTTVPIDEAEFVSISAVGRNGLTSAPSDWHGVPPTRPGQPQVVDP